RSNTYSVPKITFVENKRVEEFLYEQSDRWIASMRQHDGMFSGFQDHSLAEHYQDWVKWLWERMPNDANYHLLSNQAEVEERLGKEIDKNRLVKNWPELGELTGSLTIIGEYVLLFQTREKPYYLVQIKDLVLATNLNKFITETWKLV